MGTDELIGSTGHPRQILLRNLRIYAHPAMEGLTHRVDAIEGGSLNHLTQSYFVLCSLVCVGRH